MSAIEEYDMYPNGEDFYEDYLAQIEMGLGEPQDADVARRVFSAYLVSPFDTKRQTTPTVRLPFTGQRPSVRMRLPGGG